MDVLRYRVATIKVVLVHVAAITFVHAACHDIGGKDCVVHLHAGKREDVGLAQVGDADLAVAAIHERQNDELAVIARQVAVADCAGCKLERVDRLLAHGMQHGCFRRLLACRCNFFGWRCSIVCLPPLALCFRLGERLYVGQRQFRSDDRGFHMGVHLVNRHQLDELAQVAVQVLLRSPGTTRHAGAPLHVANPPGSQEYSGVEGCALEDVSALYGLELNDREGTIRLGMIAYSQMNGRFVTTRDCVLADDAICDVGRIVVAIRVQAEEEGRAFFLATLFASFRLVSDFLAINSSLGSAGAAFRITTLASTAILGLSHDSPRKKLSFKESATRGSTLYIIHEKYILSSIENKKQRIYCCYKLGRYTVIKPVLA